LSAVLSSGDGGAGRQLWKYLPNFSDVGYAAPLSLASISLEAWSRLDDAGRAAIEAAAKETSEHQWAALANRLAENFARMRANGVTIDDKPPAEVMAALRTAADASIADWLSRAGPDAKAIFEAHRAKMK
jgi:TRAP-type C4-dicarboxylate transport system substrate-binding protein